MVCEADGPVARIEDWVATNMPASDGAAVLEGARAMGRQEAEELAVFLDDLSW